MEKPVVPSDTPKKCSVNCNITIQYLKQAGVPLSDDDGVLIVADDITNGDKELTLSLLWNMFIHLQNYLNINSTSHMDMLLEWIQALAAAYFRSDLSDHACLQVLQRSDILEHGKAFNERTAKVLLIFSSSQLNGGKLMAQEVVNLNYNDEPEESEDDEKLGMIPATNSSIESLKKQKGSAKESKEVCTVCLNQFSVAQMSCTHIFHKDCIVSWPERSHVCPICRYEMPT